MTAHPRLHTGEPRLDRVLGGGLPPDGALMILGAPFIGKEELARWIFLTQMESGIPSIFISTQSSAADIEDWCRARDAKYDEMKKAGLAWYVDTFSASIDAADPADQVHYVDAPTDLNGIATALLAIEADVALKHERHLVVLDSASTLVLQAQATQVFRFLQILFGKAARAGATTIFLLDDGMHEDREVQVFRHLAQGVLHLRDSGEKLQVRVDGLGSEAVRGWIAYSFDGERVAVTGSLAAGRIH